MTTTRKGKSNYRASVAAYFIANPYRVVTRTEMEKELNLTSIQVRGSIAGAQFDARRKGIENWASHLRVEARGVAWMYRPQSQPTPDGKAVAVEVGPSPSVHNAGTITATPAQVITAAHAGRVTTTTNPGSITAAYYDEITRPPDVISLGTCLEVIYITKDGSLIVAADDDTTWRLNKPIRLEA